MKRKKKFLFFLLGGGTYTVIELLWRGRSHWSMFLLGGGCFLALGKLGRLRLPVPLQPIAGSLLITAGELATGLLVNSSYCVWDYRNVFGNFLGQICLPYSFLWMPLSFAGMHIYRWLDHCCPKPSP